MFLIYLFFDFICTGCALKPNTVFESTSCSSKKFTESKIKNIENEPIIRVINNRERQIKIIRRSTESVESTTTFLEDRNQRTEKESLIEIDQDYIDRNPDSSVKDESKQTMIRRSEVNNESKDDLKVSKKVKKTKNDNKKKEKYENNKIFRDEDDSITSDINVEDSSSSDKTNDSRIGCAGDRKCTIL